MAKKNYKLFFKTIFYVGFLLIFINLTQYYFAIDNDISVGTGVYGNLSDLNVVAIVSIIETSLMALLIISNTLSHLYEETEWKNKTTEWAKKVETPIVLANMLFVAITFITLIVWKNTIPLMNWDFSSVSTIVFVSMLFLTMVALNAHRLIKNAKFDTTHVTTICNILYSLALISLSLVCSGLIVEIKDTSNILYNAVGSYTNTTLYVGSILTIVATGMLLPIINLDKDTFLWW